MNDSDFEKIVSKAKTDVFGTSLTDDVYEDQRERANEFFQKNKIFYTSSNSHQAKKYRLKEDVEGKIITILFM